MNLHGKRREFHALAASSVQEDTFSVIQTLGIAVVILDLRGRITHFNRAAEVYSGYRSNEVLGKRLWEFLISRDDAPVLEQAFHVLISSGLQTEMDTTWTTRDGRERILHWSNAPVLDEGGKLKWIVDVFLDVTDERKSKLQQERAKEELEIERQKSRFLSEASYRMYTSGLDREKRLELLTSLPIPTISDWCFSVLQGMDSNDYLTAAYHWNPAKADSISKLLLWKRVASLPLFISKVSFGNRDSIENPLEARSMEEWALLNDLGWKVWMCFPISGHHLRTRGALLLASGTEGYTALRNKKQLGEELVRRVAPLLDQAGFYEDAMHAVHLRDEFISVASHELRTPLTSLRMQFQLLKNRPDFEFINSWKGQKLVTDADHQLARMSRIVLEMLDTVNISVGKLRLQLVEFDLQKLVQDVVNQLCELAALKGVKIRFESDIPVWGNWDRYRIEQVVINLIMNAIKFGQGNPVDVRVGAFQNKAFIEVEDRGLGIRQSDFQKIFERFEQISVTPSGGLGLGLYIARQIVRAHGGDITVESQLQKGSKFRIEIPLL